MNEKAQAFPNGNHQYLGLNNLEFFAAHAFSGLLAKYGDDGDNIGEIDRVFVQSLAEAAWECARIMTNNKPREVG